MFRILLFGIIRTIRPLGPLDGHLGGRFILAFFSVLCLIGAKAVFIAFVNIEYTLNTRSDGLSLSLSTAAMIVGLQFLPQLLLSSTSIGFWRSWSSIKLILLHPETLLLSSGKHFVNHEKVKIGQIFSILLYCIKSQCSLRANRSKHRSKQRMVVRKHSDIDPCLRQWDILVFIL